MIRVREAGARVTGADETPQNLLDGMRALDDVARRVRDGSLQVLKTVDLLESASAQQ